MFAAHLSPRLAIPVLRAYRENFVPSTYMKEPKSILAIPVITAETEEEAHYLSGPLELMWTRMFMGSADISFPSLAEAESHTYTLEEKRIRAQNRERFIIGSIKNVTEILKEKANEAMVDEIMIADFYPTQSSRLNAMKLLAAEFKLNSIKENYDK